MSDVRESPGVVDLTSPSEGAPHHSSRPPTFPELVYAHFAWWKEVRRPTGSDHVHRTYHRILHGFEESEGVVMDAYWCTHVESAVALTQSRRRRFPPAREIRFHRATDWATKSYPDIAAELHRCDELAIRARTVLTGVRRRICLQLVMTSASHLLSLVDARAANVHGNDTLATLKQERDALSKTNEYYCEAANGQAQMVYFGGMAAVAAVVAIAAGFALSSGWSTDIAALLAGSIGAVVSVIQRINAGHFNLSYDVGRPYTVFLGGLRPLIGAAFAVALSYAFTSGILHLPLASDASATQRHLALMVIAFLAGFSERWAQDTLATALPSAGASAASSGPAPPSGSGESEPTTPVPATNSSEPRS